MGFLIDNSFLLWYHWCHVVLPCDLFPLFFFLLEKLPMIIGVNYIDKDGEFCWAEFSSAQAAVDFCGIENIISWEHY